jgi:hypothetical protein
LAEKTPQTSPPPAFGLIHEGRDWSVKIDDISLQPPGNLFMSTVLCPCHSIVINPYYGCISVAFRCRAGVDVNIVNLQGRSPLRIALLEGNLDLAGLLLDNGANIDYLDNDSRLEKEETFLFSVASSEFFVVYQLSLII